VTDRKKVEDKLRVLSRAVEQNPASIVITDTFGLIEYVNPKFSELTGYSLNEVLGRNPRILKSGMTSSSEYAVLWKTIMAGGEWQGEFKNTKKSGEEYYEAALISPIKNELGQITHFLAVKEDITGQKNDEILIRKLSKAIGQSPVSTIITDANGKIEFVNSAFVMLTQYTPEEVINKSPRIFNRGHIAEADFNSMWENVMTGKVWKGEFKNRRKDKSTYWEDVTISSLMNSDGVISNFILIMDDISEKKKMLDDLIAAKETAEESNRLKSAFLAMMNHELRTPLSHILGFSELIMSGVAPEDNVNFASSIQTSGQSLLSIIEGVFDMALVEQSKIKLRKQTFSLIDHFMENKASFDNILRVTSKHEKIQLIFKPDTRWLSSYVTADRSKINQILTNLFKNAIKFTHRGTIEFGYRIEDESTLMFYVKDTGIGIPIEKQSIIFDFFRQGDDSFTRGYDGIGIGLAVSKKIAKILQGELKVVSEAGGGSTFSLTIPVELSNIKE
jgi:PAS domain S-box-containing protein